MIPAVVLAAGMSTRMGRVKANLPIGNSDTFLSRIVRTLIEGGVDDVVVVVGYDADAVMREFARRELPARFVQNPGYETGQLSTLLAGLGVVDRPGTTATLVTLVDVPFVSSSTVRSVIETYRRTHAPIVRPTRGAIHGHPLLIDRALFERVRTATLSEGIKSLVRAHASSVGDFPSEDDGAFLDIDTPEEYEAALRKFEPATNEGFRHRP